MADIPIISTQLAIERMRRIKLIHNLSWHGTPHPGETWGWGIRPLHLLHFVTCGQGLLEIPGKAFPLSAGQLFYIEPNQPIRYSSSTDNPITYWWVEWLGDGIEELIEAIGFDREHPVITMRNPAEVLAAMDALERTQDITLADTMEHIGQLYRLMACFLHNSTRANLPVVKDSEIYFNVATRYIHSHLHAPELTVTATAKHTCISRKYLHTIFTQYAGKSVNDYIIDTRIATAKELLRLTQLSVSSVAMSVGYSDPFSFTRIFKKRVGMSPSQYAQKNQEKKA